MLAGNVDNRTQIERHVFWVFFGSFLYSEKRRLNSPRANKRAQIKLQNNTEYYGLKRMSLRVDFRNDEDWVSFGCRRESVVPNNYSRGPSQLGNPLPS